MNVGPAFGLVDSGQKYVEATVGMWTANRQKATRDKKIHDLHVTFTGRIIKNSFRIYCLSGTIGVRPVNDRRIPAGRQSALRMNEARGAEFFRGTDE